MFRVGKKLLAAAATAATLTAAVPVVAEQDDALNLRRITVTATRSPLAAIETPATIHTLDAIELRMRTQARTTPEALRNLPGVMVQKTGHGQGSPYIRGFTGFRTLFLVDGIRLNNSTFRDGPNQYWNTVDPLSIATLELVKGPVSVLYGSDAIGGTANAITADPRDLAGDGAGSQMIYRYADAERAGTVRIEGARAFGDRLAMRAGMSIKDFGDLHSGGGTYRQTGYRETDADAKLTWETRPGRWTLLHQRVDIEDAWRTHRTVFGRSFAGTTVGNEKRRSLNQWRRLSYLRFETDRVAPLDNLQVTLSHHDQAEDRLRIRADERRDIQGFDVNTLGLAVQASQAARGRWDYGVEYYRDSVDSFRTDFNADGTLRAQRIQGPVGDDARYDTGGAYVQHTSAWAGIDWILGGRYTYAAARAGRVQDPVSGDPVSLADNWDALVGSVRALYRPVDSRWSLFGGISQGFRAPNLSDLTRLDSARSNEIEVPVARLAPEDFVNFELGAKLAGTSWHLQLAVFHTEIADLITRTPTGREIDGELEVTKRNAGDGHVQGFEAEWQLALTRQLDLFGAFSWIDGQASTFPTSSPVAVVEPLDRLMPATLVTGLRWRQPGDRRWLELSVVQAAAADRLSTRDSGDSQRIPPGGTPGYAVAHLRAGMAIGRQLQLAFALENLTDRDYRVHGSGVNEPGRNAVLTLNWRPGG